MRRRRRVLAGGVGAGFRRSGGLRLVGGGSL